MSLSLNTVLKKSVSSGLANGVVLSSSLLLISCSITPEYQAPSLPSTQQYTHIATSSIIGGDNNNTSQQLIHENNLPAQWWTLFKSEQLNILIERALKASPELAAAQAVIRQAQANYLARGVTNLPSVDLNTGVSRQKFSGASVGIPDAETTILTLYNASIDVSYTIDLFSKNKNSQQVAKSQLAQEQWRHKATHLTLTANLVSQYIQLAALNDELQQQQKLQAIEQSKLALLTQDIALGGTAKAALLTQKNLINTQQKTQRNIEKQRIFAQNQLAILIGTTPAQLVLSLPTLKEMTLPPTLPVSLPSQLVQQRPDIQLAESVIKTKHAALGIAIANQYPQLTLSSSYGTLALDHSDLFEPASVVWNAAAGLTQPLFNSGKLKQKEAAAQAAFEQSHARYQQTVLVAFKQVADSLRALDYDAQTHHQALASEKNTADLYALSQQEKQLGALTKLDLLSAEQALHQAKINSIQAQAAQLADTVALFQSLGGGWWNNTTSDNTENK